jgi:hypothetical protein
MEASGAGEPVLPTTETDDTGEAASKVTEEQWNAMRSVLDSLLAFRDDECVISDSSDRSTVSNFQQRARPIKDLP